MIGSLFVGAAQSNRREPHTAATFGGGKVAGLRFREHFDTCRCFVELKREGRAATRALVVASAHRGGSRVEIHRPRGRSAGYALFMVTWMSGLLALQYGTFVVHFLAPLTSELLGVS